MRRRRLSRERALKRAYGRSSVSSSAAHAGEGFWASARIGPTMPLRCN